MALAETSGLLREAKSRWGITDGDLIAAVAKQEDISISAARGLVVRFTEGGPCPSPVGEVLIKVIADIRAKLLAAT